MKMDTAHTKRELLAVLPDLRRFAISVAGNAADGDDLVQSTVERVLKSGVPHDANMKKWVFRVTKNLWTDKYRETKVRQNAAGQIALVYDAEQDGERLAHNRLMLARAKNLINSLPEDQRIVMTLVTIEGYSYKEVAETLEVPIGTIMSRLARARKTINQQFSGQKQAGAAHV